jgi:trimethylamine---corrinoid protein Co-methyltransferase
MNDANDFSLWQRPYFQILSEEQQKRIYHGALEILERMGGDFFDEEAIELLASAGAHVEGKRRVRIPSPLVQSALQNAPKRVVLCDRNGNRKMFLEGRNFYFGNGSDTIHTMDIYSGERRHVVKDDVIRAARVIDSLSEMDFCMSFGIASDVNEMTSDCHHFEAMVLNTVKPLIITSWNLDGLKRIFDMMVAIKGSEKILEREPFVIVFLMAISPMTFPKDSLQKLLFCAEKRIPVIWTGGCPTMGATAPITPAGSLVVGVAEFLSGLVIAQLKEKGCPVIAGGSFGNLDMKTSLRPYNSPEADFGHICVAEMARYFQLPSWGVGGTSDSNVLDEQAAAEAHQKLFLSAIAGSNLIHDVGYIDNGMTSSFELLVMCNDFAGRVRRFLRGFVVSEETMALDVIHQIGPGKEYLTHSSTLSRFKEESWMPELMSRQYYQSWEKSGGKTMKQLANEKVRWIVENHKSQGLPEDVEKQVKKIVQTFDQEPPRGSASRRRGNQ